MRKRAVLKGLGILLATASLNPPGVLHQNKLDSGKCIGS